MSIVDFIESLREDITSSEISSKKDALKRLAIYLSGLPSSVPNSDSINCLTTFYENILSEHYQLLPTITDGISTLIDFDNFKDMNARQIASALVKLDVPQLDPQVRLKIYELLNDLLTSFLNALKSFDDRFINDFLNSIYGENSPECVVSVLRICLIIIENFNIDRVYEELFESVAVYFPVEMKKTNNTSSKVTKELLTELNKKCLIGSALFGPQLLPILLEKATADKKSSRIDSLDILAEGLGQMNFEDVFNYHMSFLDCLLHQFKNRDSDCQALSLKCADSIARTFQKHASDPQLIEFCWHLYEITSGIIIENDKKLLQFLLSAVAGKCRVWCGVLANFLAPLLEKLLKLDFEDTEKLDILVDLLSAGDNLPQYKGLMDSSKADGFFTKLNLIYMEILNNPNTIENHEKLSIMFNLMAHYSLFNIWISNGTNNANYDNDVNSIIGSRCQLISKSMAYLAKNTNIQLELSVLKLTPKLLESSISLTTVRNQFTELVLSYSQENDSLQKLGFRLLESVPVSCLELVLPIIDLKLKDLPLVATVASCFARLTERFSNDPETTELLCMFFLTVLDDILIKQSHLDPVAVSNIALALSELGIPEDESLKSRIIEELLRASRANDLSEPSVMWLCSILGQSSIPMIQRSIMVSDLLNLLYAMIFAAGNGEIKSILCQTYASLINKLEEPSDFDDFILHLEYRKDDSEFLLWNLKASMMSSKLDYASKLIDVIVDPIHISTGFGLELVKRIPILMRLSSMKKHFCSELKLFPKQNLFYHQQSFHLVAQPFRSMAIDDSNIDCIKDISMEIYLKLISSYPQQVVDLYIDEIIQTVGQWFKKLVDSNSKISLRIEALKAVCNLNSSVNHLEKYTDDIAGNIIATGNSIGLLSVRDRYFLAEVIGWFTLSFPKHKSDQFMIDVKLILRKLIDDKKRIVRMEAAKSQTVLF